MPFFYKRKQKYGTKKAKKHKQNKVYPYLWINLRRGTRLRKLGYLKKKKKYFG